MVIGPSGAKPSNYNFFWSKDGHTVGFNGRTGAFALVPEAAARELEGGSVPSDPNLLKDLLRLGFVQTRDELSLIEERFANRMAGKEIHLTIMPSLACDRRCTYCFQKGVRSNKVMSTSVEAVLLGKFLPGLAQEAAALRVTFYGGEPLLEIETVCRLAKAFSTACEGLKKRVNFSVITNATRLDAATVSRLSESGIRSVQATFDSLVDGVDRRGVWGSSGCPSTILANLIQARAHLDVTVRVNVMRENQKDVLRILSVLDEFGFAGKYYLANVYDYCAVPASQDVLGDIERRVLAANAKPVEYLAKRLSPKTQFCAATSCNLFVVDPDGLVYRCWHAAGDESQALGRVEDSIDELNSSVVAKSWADYSPLRFTECRGCRVLPLCMGGCSYRTVARVRDEPYCESVRHLVQFYLDRFLAQVDVGSFSSA